MPSENCWTTFSVIMVFTFPLCLLSENGLAPHCSVSHTVAPSEVRNHGQWGWLTRNRDPLLYELIALSGWLGQNLVTLGTWTNVVSSWYPVCKYFFSLYMPIFPRWDYNQNFKKFLVQEFGFCLRPKPMYLATTLYWSLCCYSAPKVSDSGKQFYSRSGRWGCW